MDFNNFKITQLRSWLKKINLAGVSRMKKDELVRYTEMYFPLIQRLINEHPQRQESPTFYKQEKHTQDKEQDEEQDEEDDDLTF